MNENRQTAVLHLIAEGLSNKEIAEHLGIANKTVKAHITVLFKTHGYKSRLQCAVAYWKAEIAKLRADTKS